MKRGGAAAAIALALALVAAAFVVANGEAATRAFGGEGRWITYPDGRVFVPHGFNTVVSKPPYYNARLGADDARLLADEGFTTMRLLYLPSALEPVLGEPDAAYAQRFVAQARLLGRYGITTFLGVDQLRYAEPCGGEGFPAWAVLVDCGTGAQRDPDAAWARFLANDPAADGVGLQQHFTAWWTDMATRFAGSTSLLGYDLLNEPPRSSPQALGRMLAGAVDAVRAVDPHHLVFVEPDDPGWPRFGNALPAGLGFGGHVYCDATLQKAFAQRLPTRAQIDRCIRENATMLATQISYATNSGSPLLVGEFGASDELREQEALLTLLDRSFVPWQGYAYSAHLDTTGTRSQGILRDDAKPASQRNAKQAKLDLFAVPHAMAIAGTPRSWSFDRAARVVRFTYSTKRVGGGVFRGRPQTVVFVPRRHYPSGYSVAVSGARAVSKPTAPWLRLVADRGAATVTVRIEPRAGSTTLTPLQVDQCGYDLGSCG